MKSFIIFFLLSAQALGVTLGQYVSHPDGSSFQSFSLESEKVIYEKHSNYFDKEKDLRLGHFTLSKKIDLEIIKKRLNKIHGKIKDVDEYLKKKNSSFNDLSSKKPHQSFILLNSYRITKDSTYYPELKEIYDELFSQEWVQVSGIKISDDLKKVISINGGNAVSEEAFNMHFYCKSPVPPTICTYKDLGILYIQK